MSHIRVVVTWLVDALPDISNLVLALLGVLMSLPTLAENIEKRRPIRYAVASVCIGLGFAGFIIGANQRRAADTKMGTLVNTVSDAKNQQNTLQAQLNESLRSQGRMEGQLQLLSGAIKNSGVRQLITLVNNLAQPPSFSSLSPEQLRSLAIAFAQRMREFDQQYFTYIRTLREKGYAGGPDWVMMYDEERYTPQFRETYLKEFLSMRNEILRRLNQAQTDIPILSRPRNRLRGGDATELADYLEGLAKQLAQPAAASFDTPQKH
jgi:hypothetical protein